MRKYWIAAVVVVLLVAGLLIRQRTIAEHDRAMREIEADRKATGDAVTRAAGAIIDSTR